MCNRFAIRFPERQRPLAPSAKKIIQNFQNFGSVNLEVQKRKPLVENENIELGG